MNSALEFICCFNKLAAQIIVYNSMCHVVIKNYSCSKFTEIVVPWLNICELIKFVRELDGIYVFFNNCLIFQKKSVMKAQFLLMC